MHDVPSPLGPFTGQVRLFPLPNLVLFPHVVQPLHIFEPRYRQLMADALAGDRLITMALLQPGWEEEYDQRPAIHSVVCIGRIFKEEKLPDGRYNLLLQGLARARVIDEVPTDRLYRVARVQLAADVPVADAESQALLRKQLRERLQSWFTAQPPANEQLRKLLLSQIPLGALCDIFGFALPIEPEKKQELLAETHVEQRVAALLSILDSLQPAQSVAPASKRRFPPDFSSN